MELIFIHGQEGVYPTFCCLSLSEYTGSGNEKQTDSQGEDRGSSPLFVKACPSCNYMKVPTCTHNVEYFSNQPGGTFLEPSHSPYEESISLSCVCGWVFAMYHSHLYYVTYQQRRAPWCYPWQALHWCSVFRLAQFWICSCKLMQASLFSRGCSTPSHTPCQPRE